jgi:hypothetical protein
MSEIKGNATAKKEKIENPKDTITLNEAMLILKDKSKITKKGLRGAAVRDGFKSKYTGNGKEKYLLDKLKFEKWINDTIDAIPSGFLPIAKAAKELDVTSIWVYRLIAKHNVKTKKAGSGIGKMYVDFVTLKNIFSIRKNKRK